MLFPVDREAYLPLILWSFIVGILFGAVYDIFRIRRIAFRMPGGSEKKKSRFLAFFRRNLAVTDAVIVFFEDILFFLFCTVVLILVDFKLYFGVPRWYSIAFSALGFTVYHLTVGKLVVLSAEAILRFIRKGIRFVKKYMVLPVCHFFGRIVHSAFSAAERRRRRQFTENEEKRILRSAVGRLDS